jgi:hypothetical protein
MRLHRRFAKDLIEPRPRRVSRPRAQGRGRLCPRLERFEDRTLLSSYSAASVSDLIKDMNAANRAGGTNTITLTAPTTSPYVLTAVDNTTDGPTGLPVISGGKKPDALTILGNNDTIERSTASGTPTFRLFDVAAGGSLTLNDLTLQNGLAFGLAANGGAVYNQGALMLSGVTVQNNMAQGANGANGTKHNPSGQPGAPAFGGGIFSAGTALTLENGTVIQNNEALGGNGGNAPGGPGGDGGNAQGGGVFVSAGTVTFTSTTLGSNLAQSGSGGTGRSGGSAGYGYGGGLAISAGTVNLTSVMVNSNHVDIGKGIPTNAVGGGIYIGSGTVTLSNDTVQSNTATPASGGGSGGGIKISGGTVLLSNDTVQSNTAGLGGGGIEIENATVTLCNDTVQSNTASIGGGIASGGVVYIDSFTVNNTTNNSRDNIEGSYILQNC